MGWNEKGYAGLVGEMDVPGHKDEVGALSCQCTCSNLTNPAGGTSNEHGLILQHCVLFPFLFFFTSFGFVSFFFKLL